MNQPEKHDITSRHRSFKGCWTCKKKRVQCDEVRPACTKCTSRGLVCGGYEIRLRWGAGIASRGKYSGAAKPVKESIPAQSRRRWDMRGKGEKSPGGDGQGQPTLVAPPLQGKTGKLEFRSTLTGNDRSISVSSTASYGQYTQHAVGARRRRADFRYQQAF